MALARHNLTRRALLGAGAGVPFALAVPGAVAARGHVLVRVPTSEAGIGTRRRWKRALAAYRGAAQALEGFCRDRLTPAVDAHQAIRARWPLDFDCRGDPKARALLEPAFAAIGPLEDRADDLECVRLAALRRLLRLPAPDLPALSLKVDLIVDDQAWELTDADLCLAALKADARRLAGGG